jgi:hypothetical protein
MGSLFYLGFQATQGFKDSETTQTGAPLVYVGLVTLFLAALLYGFVFSQVEVSEELEEAKYEILDLEKDESL